MGRKRLSADLFVFMNGEKVGRLTRTASGRFEFRYDQQWLQSPLRRPISLCLPLSPEPHAGDFVEYFFDNLLPDNQSIRNRIQPLVPGLLLVDPPSLGGYVPGTAGAPCP